METELLSFVDAVTAYAVFETREAIHMKPEDQVTQREAHSSLMVHHLTSLLMTLGLVE